MLFLERTHFATSVGKEGGRERGREGGREAGGVLRS